jgi:hypothetical protein
MYICVKHIRVCVYVYMNKHARARALSLSLTSTGVISPARVVKPTISEKKMVTL